MRTVKFDSVVDLNKGLMMNEYYDKESETLFFRYNDDGAVAYYCISFEELMELVREATPEETYPSALLGPGGYIIDVDEEYEPEGDDYIDPAVDEFLSPFVGKNLICANIKDLLEE